MRISKCSKCNKEISPCETYEYRGACSCEDCFDEVIEMRDRQRNEIMREEHAKTDKFKGLDLSDSVVGKENRKILKGSLEVAGKESDKLKEYERGDL